MATVKKAQNGDSTSYKKTLSGLTSQGLDFEIGKLSKMVTPKSAPSIIQQKIDILKREKSKRSELNTTPSVKKNKTGGVTKAKDGKWIQSAIKKPGALRAQLGAKPGKPIPAGKLAAAAKKPGKLGQRARLAQTLKKMKK